MSDDFGTEAGKFAVEILKSSKIISKVSDTFCDTWDLVFANWISLFNQKQKIKHEYHLEDYKYQIAQKMGAIPIERQQDPALDIVGPALEASKFYIEEEEIRELFANLIASSMDSYFNGYTHHSFVEIIKQLSSHDSKLFISFNEKNFLVDILAYSRSKNTHFTLKSTVYFTNLYNDYEANLVSIANLERLGLIKITPQGYLTDFHCFHIYDSILEEIKKGVENKEYAYIDSPEEVSLKKYSLSLSNFGLAFKKVCYKNEESQPEETPTP